MSRRWNLKWWPKRLALGLGIVLIFPLLLAAFERLRGETALKRRLGELSARGEVLDVTALRPERVPRDQNAFYTLATLTNRSDAILTNLLMGPPLLRYTAPGRVAVSWQASEWLVGNVTNQWDQFAASLEQGDELLALLHSAASKPHFSSDFDYGKGFVDFQLGPIANAKQGVQLLSAATLNDLRHHRWASAQSNLWATVRLAAMQQPEPSIICQLVRLACATIAVHTTWQALQAPEWNGEQLAALQTLWETARFPEDMARALEMERAMTQVDFEKFRRSDSGLRSLLQQRDTMDEFWDRGSRSLPTGGFVRHTLHIPFWRFAWLAQDQLRALNHWQLIIERERLARTNCWAALPTKIGPTDELYSAFPDADSSGELNLYDRLRFLRSSEPLSINDTLIRKELQMQTLQHLVITAIAIQRYRHASSTMPRSLSELAPHYLRTVLVDPMDGQPLRYRADGTNGFVLYSVGTDGKDQGGDPSAAADTKTYRQIWDGKDAVWPSPSKR